MIKANMKFKQLIILVVVQLLFLNLSAQSETISTENNYLFVERQDKELNSRLSKKYIGYEYLIKNKYNETIEIKQTTLRKHASAQIAYLSIKIPEQDIKNSAYEKAKKNALKTIGLSYVTTFVTLPFKQITNNIGNENALKEAEKFDKKIEKLTRLEPNKTLEIRTMALKKHKPILNIFYKNPLTDETMKLDL